MFVFVLVSCATHKDLELYRTTFNYEDEHISIKVNHKQNEYKFLFDTGAPVCMIEPSIQNDFIIENIENCILNQTKIPMFFNELSVGPYAIRNLYIGIIDFSDISNLDFDGILGLSYFANFVFGLDYKKNELILGFSVEDLMSEFNYATFNELSIIDNGYGFNLHVEVIFNGKVYPALIDTGAGSSCIPQDITESIIKTNPELVRKSLIVKELQDFFIGDLRNNTESNSYVRLPMLEFGGIKYKDLSFKTWSQDFLLLGNDFLKNFTWIYDYNNKTILARSELKEHEKLELTNYLKANFDIYRYNDGRLIVKEVVIGSAPWNEGLRPSMTIVKINGKDITGIKESKDIKAVYNYDYGKIRTLTIVNNKGENVTYSFVKETLSD